MNIKNLFLISFILGLTISSIGQNLLSEDKTFKKTFLETEIKDLQLLFDFFNESICSELETNSLTECYQEFFKRMEKSEGTGNIQLNISFDRQLEVCNQFSDATFSEIWSYGEIYRYPDAPIDICRTVYYTWDGKYLEFLKKVGRNDKVIKNYYETAVAAGDISPSIIAGLLFNHKYYDIEDIRIKFIVAIHYLTLNDHFKRKEKIY